MSLPLRTARISAFRGLQEVTLEDFGRVNLLVGGTNSGKTSVLEALSLVEDPMDPLAWIRIANRREPSPLAARLSSKVDRLRYLFPVRNGERRPVAINIEGHPALRSFRARSYDLSGTRKVWTDNDISSEDLKTLLDEEERSGIEVFIETTAEQSLLPGFQFEDAWQVWDDEPVQGRRRSSTLGSRPRFRAITPYEHWLRPHATKDFSEAVLLGEEHHTLELLRRIEPHIHEVRVLTTQLEPSLYLRYAGAGLLPVSAFGDGIRRVLTLALNLPRIANGVLFIDEIETGLHVSMLSKVYSWLITACHELNIQLFATTHSLEALDALLEADPTPVEDIVCYQLSHRAYETTVKRFSENQIKRLRNERGLDLR